MSQAVNTYWDERIERVASTAKVSPIERRRVRARRLVDGVVLMIMLAAAATCMSVYSRARAELNSAITKHEAAGDKVRDLTIRVDKFERDVQQLRTDSRVIESLARQKFGFVRSGDVVIKLPQAPTDSVKSSTDVRASNLTPRIGEGYTGASN